MDADARIARTAARHHGIVRRRDAVAAGLTDRQVASRVRSGRWERLRPGVYRICGAPPTPHQELAAAVAATRGVASHRSAGWLHGLLDRPVIPEVTVRTAQGHLHHGVRLHRTTDLHAEDRTQLRGIEVTDPTRTCIDLGARLDERRLERVLDRAVHLQLTTVDELLQRFTRLARRGRDGIATVRVVLERMDLRLAPAESDLETVLFRVLRDAGLPTPVRQHVVSVRGRLIRIDLAYPELRIAIEGDGFLHHGGRMAFEDDRERQNLLALDGWTVLRFTWRQLWERPAWVADQVRRAIDRATSQR